MSYEVNMPSTTVTSLRWPQVLMWNPKTRSFSKSVIHGHHVFKDVWCYAKSAWKYCSDGSTDRSIAVHIHVANVRRATHAGRGFIITSLFGAYPLLGACLLTTYAHKRINNIRLIARCA